MTQNKLMFLSAEERQLFVTTVMNGRSAVGTLAIFTNIGVILYHGAIANNGIYYTKDERLPMTTDQDNALRAFKRLCVNGIDDNDLRDFPIFFGKLENITDGQVAWSTVSNILEKTPEGRAFVKRYNFKIHALINMKSGHYGVIYDRLDRTGNLHDGHVLHDDSNDTLILDVDGKKICSRPRKIILPLEKTK